MLTKRQLFGMLVGLTKVNDISLINDPKIMSHEVCFEGDIPLIRRMAVIMGELYDTFDYTKSPEFLRSIAGKSDAVRAMRLKLVTPQRRTEMRKRLGDALMKFMESDDIMELVEPSRHERIKELKGLLFEISNPDDSM